FTLTHASNNVIPLPPQVSLECVYTLAQLPGDLQAGPTQTAPHFLHTHTHTHTHTHNTTTTTRTNRHTHTTTPNTHHNEEPCLNVSVLHFCHLVRGALPSSQWNGRQSSADP